MVGFRADAQNMSPNKMAVQEADRALDEWLTTQIKSWIGVHKNHHDQGYLSALQDVQHQLHEFWGASLKEGNDDKTEEG